MGHEHATPTARTTAARDVLTRPPTPAAAVEPERSFAGADPDTPTFVTRTWAQAGFQRTETHALEGRLEFTRSSDGSTGSIAILGGGRFRVTLRLEHVQLTFVMTRSTVERPVIGWAREGFELQLFAIVPALRWPIALATSMASAHLSVDFINEVVGEIWGPAPRVLTDARPAWRVSALSAFVRRLAETEFFGFRNDAALATLPIDRMVRALVRAVERAGDQAPTAYAHRIANLRRLVTGPDAPAHIAALRDLLSSDPPFDLGVWTEDDVATGSRAEYSARWLLAQPQLLELIRGRVGGAQRSAILAARRELLGYAETIEGVRARALLGGLAALADRARRVRDALRSVAAGGDSEAAVAALRGVLVGSAEGSTDEAGESTSGDEVGRFEAFVRAAARDLAVYSGALALVPERGEARARAWAIARARHDVVVEVIDLGADRDGGGRSHAVLVAPATKRELSLRALRADGSLLYVVELDASMVALGVTEPTEHAQDALARPLEEVAARADAPITEERTRALERDIYARMRAVVLRRLRTASDDFERMGHDESALATSFLTMALDEGADAAEAMLRQGLPLAPDVAHDIANELWEIGALIRPPRSTASILWEARIPNAVDPHEPAAPTAAQLAEAARRLRVLIRSQKIGALRTAMAEQRQHLAELERSIRARDAWEPSAGRLLHRAFDGSALLAEIWQFWNGMPLLREEFDAALGFGFAPDAEVTEATPVGNLAERVFRDGLVAQGRREPRWAMAQAAATIALTTAATMTGGGGLLAGFIVAALTSGASVAQAYGARSDAMASAAMGATSIEAAQQADREARRAEVNALLNVATVAPGFAAWNAGRAIGLTGDAALNLTTLMMDPAWNHMSPAQRTEAMTHAALSMGVGMGLGAVAHRAFGGAHPAGQEAPRTPQELLAERGARLITDPSNAENVAVVRAQIEGNLQRQFGERVRAEYDAGVGPEGMVARVEGDTVVLRFGGEVSAWHLRHHEAAVRALLPYVGLGGRVRGLRDRVLGRLTDTPTLSHEGGLAAADRAKLMRMDAELEGMMTLLEARIRQVAASGEQLADVRVLERLAQERASLERQIALHEGRLRSTNLAETRQIAATRREGDATQEESNRTAADQTATPRRPPTLPPPPREQAQRNEIVEVRAPRATQSTIARDSAAAAPAVHMGGGVRDPNRGDRSVERPRPRVEPSPLNPQQLRQRAVDAGLHTTELTPRLERLYSEADPAILRALETTISMPAGDARDQRLLRLVEWAEGRPDLPARVQEGQTFGRGGTGSVAEVTSRPDLASKMGAGRASTEAAAMVELELAGIPTVYLGERRLDSGASRLILRRIDGVGSKDIIGRVKSGPENLEAARANEQYVTQRTISDLEAIQARLTAARLNIGDFQFIIRYSDGAVFVNDPTGITPNSGPGGSVIGIIGRFRAILRRRMQGQAPQ